MLNIEIEKFSTYQLGMEKGAYMQAMTIAGRLLDINMEPQKIADITELPLTDIVAYRTGRETGKQEGTQAKALAIALRLHAMQMGTQQIVEITGLSPAEVDILQTSPAEEA